MSGLVRSLLVALCLSTLGTVAAAAPPARGPLVAPYVSVDAPVIALRHVRLIDGTGAPPREDQTIVIRDAKIAVVGGAKTSVPTGARPLDLRGKTVIPGLVMMHEHLFYPPKEVPGPTMLLESYFVPQPWGFSARSPTARRSPPASTASSTASSSPPTSSPASSPTSARGRRRRSSRWRSSTWPAPRCARSSATSSTTTWRSTRRSPSSRRWPAARWIRAPSPC